MSVRPRKDRKGRWTVDVVVEHPDGRVERVVKTAPLQSRRAAEAYERELRQAILNGARAREEERKNTPAPERPTLASFVADRWLPTYPDAAGNRACTIAEKRWALYQHILPELGSVRLDAIRAERVERFAAALRARGLSAKTIKNLLSVLRRVLASAVEWGTLETLPRFPRVKVPERDFDHYTVEEGARLVAGARDDDERAVLLFALATGARAGEQAAVEWGDVDLERGEVSFRRNRPSTLRETGPTKSGKVRRVPIAGELVAALRRVRHLRSKLVFCRADGSHLEIWDLHKVLERATARSGLRKVRWHDLRHSFASQAVAAGVPLNVVQAWMGHSTITMTMRYAHLAPDAGATWVRVLEQSRNQGATKAAN